MYFSNRHDSAWETEHLHMINKIIILSEQHGHTKNIFKKNKRLFAGTKSELNPKVIINDFLEIDDEVVTPHQFIDIVERMSIFKLIALAAGKNLTPLLEPPLYRENDLIKQFTIGSVNMFLNDPNI